MFLLPVQLDLLGIPSLRVTRPTCCSTSSACPERCCATTVNANSVDRWPVDWLIGTVPGVILGAVLRVYSLPGAEVFRLLLAALLGPLGVLMLLRRPNRDRSGRFRVNDRGITILAVAAGIVGGICGIGGGSLLSSILVSAGLPLIRVAPAALLSAYLTSVVGATPTPCLPSPPRTYHSRLDSRPRQWLRRSDRRLPRRPAPTPCAARRPAAASRRHRSRPRRCLPAARHMRIAVRR